MDIKVCFLIVVQVSNMDSCIYYDEHINTYTLHNEYLRHHFNLQGHITVEVILSPDVHKTRS